jgi:restriction system protein
MTSATDPIALTPREFELEVKSIMQSMGADMSSFRAEHREHIQGVDGSYEIDVSVRFSVMEMDFLVLVECKHQKNPVKREAVQVLHDRLRSVGAQKGVLFSTSSFQSGALEYAKQHGIALVIIADGRTCWGTRMLGPAQPAPAWANIPKYIGWWCQLTDEGHEQRTIVSKADPEHFREYFTGPVIEPGE